MRRREFLKSAGCFVATASTGMLTWPGCGDDNKGSSPSGAVAFPHGVASGDPRPDSIVLWTRAESSASSSGPIALTLEVATDDKFAKLMVMKSISASSASDFTVRVLVDGLDSDSIYYYRFRAGDDVSRVGRTRTAPALDADVEVRFAWVCCQDYAANFYSAYRRMLNDDMNAPEDQQLRFVMHIGDFIYETQGMGDTLAHDDDLQPVALKSASGDPRVIGDFPSGGGMAKDGTVFANTVDDYRHLYKTYLLDPDLQDARARWPFIAVWDDHEFSDDCWQTQANYDNDNSTDEPSQKRRVAASQAWFEYVPSALSDAQKIGDVAPAAKDFKFAEVEDAPYSDFVVVDEPNNVAALGAITIYRNFRWGQHLELILTDNRSYRSDQPIPEEAAKMDLLIFAPRNVLPIDAVNGMDAGSAANGGNPPDTFGSLPNERKNSAPGSLLGATQKQWWKDTLQGSQATFKVWGNTVPLLRLLLDTSDVPLLNSSNLVLSDDGWDGYNSERKELMQFLLDNQISNVVSLSGDHHAFFAGVVYADYDADQKVPVMVDLVTAGISSDSQFIEVASALATGVPAAFADVIGPIKQLIYYDGTQFGGSDKTVVNLNTLIRYGSHAANVAAATNDVSMIEAARNAAANDHLRYVDTRSIGYGLAHVSAGSIDASFVTIERSYEDLGTKSPDIRGTAAFTIAKVDAPTDAALPEPDLTGKKPFPLA